MTTEDIHFQAEFDQPHSVACACHTCDTNTAIWLTAVQAIAPRPTWRERAFTRTLDLGAVAS